MRKPNARGTRRWLSTLGALVVGLVGLTATPAAADYNTTAPRLTGTANNTVFAITVEGNRTYIAGKFTKVKNPATGKLVTRTGIAAFDTSTGLLDTTFNVTIDGTVRTVVPSADGGTLFIGGTFTTVDGAARTNLAAIDSSGNLLSSWNTPVNGEVRDLIRVGNDLYVAGNFSRVNNIIRSGLAKVAVGNGALSSWKVTIGGGKPRSIVASPNGTDLLVAGSFATLGGQPRPFLGSVALADAAVTAWAPPAACDTCDVFDIVASPTAVYGAVGGGGGRAVKWSSTADTMLWSVKSDGNAQAVALGPDGALYVGGHFGPTFAGQPRSQLAAVSADTGKVLPFAPDLGTQYYPGVWALDAGSDYLRVGGGFLTVNGVSQTRYAEFPFA